MAELGALNPYPTGWFAVGFSKDLATGQVQTLHYFGKDIVLFRTDDGEAVAVEPYCPHLGAHLGHGGEVEGNSIRCPFHHWRFSAEGHCVEIPGCSKLPARARLTRYPLKEQDDVIFVFHQGGGAHAEPFEFPPLGLDGLTPSRFINWTVRTHPQEVCENTVDMAHLLPIHAVTGAHVIKKPHIDGAHMNVVLEFVAPGDLIDMPGQDNDVQLDVIIDGLGRIVSRTHVKNVGVRARQAIYCTPIDGDRMDLRGVVNTVIGEDLEFTESVSELFFESFVHDFQKDFPIWENKTYYDRPMLSAADGPVGLYRKWVRQFYPARAARQTKRERPSLLDRVRERVFEVIDRGRSVTDAPLPERRPASPVGTVTVDTGPSMAVISVEDYFARLEERFVPAGSKGVDAVFQWKLSGKCGVDCYAVVSDGQMDLHDGVHDQPTVTISMTADDYVRLVNREIDGAWAFTSGRAKLSGSIPMAMKMRKIFPQ